VLAEVNEVGAAMASLREYRKELGEVGESIGEVAEEVR
jgi:hypothetical protein